MHQTVTLLANGRLQFAFLLQYWPLSCLVLQAPRPGCRSGGAHTKLRLQPKPLSLPKVQQPYHLAVTLRQVLQTCTTQSQQVCPQGNYAIRRE